MVRFAAAQLLAHSDWPDGFDSVAVGVFLAGVVILPALGYWFMVLDVRAYLRSLKGMLVVVRNRFRGTPEWAKQETPGCLRSLGLELPCTEEEVKVAYRRLAEQLHPDRGGDRRRFMLAHRQFEEAIRFLRDLEADS